MSKLALGVDPGLRTTGVVVVRSNGPGLPTLEARASIRLAAAGDDQVQADAMAEAVATYARGAVELFNYDLDVVAIEAFEYRPYLVTEDGERRRVTTSPAMGRLVGRLADRLASIAEVVEVEAAATKAGYPAAERFRKALLPKRLRNRHERDAFLAASYALSVHGLERFAR